MARQARLPSSSETATAHRPIRSICAETGCRNFQFDVALAVHQNVRTEMKSFGMGSKHFRQDKSETESYDWRWKKAVSNTPLRVRATIRPLHNPCPFQALSDASLHPLIAAGSQKLWMHPMSHPLCGCPASQHFAPAAKVKMGCEVASGENAEAVRSSQNLLTLP